MTLDLAEAESLRKVVRETRKVFVLTHNYSGNALVQEARERVRSAGGMSRKYANSSKLLADSVAPPLPVFGGNFSQGFSRLEMGESGVIVIAVARPWLEL